MRKLAILFMAGSFGFIAQASAQTPAQAPAKPKAATAPRSATTAKPATPAVRAYDRALLRPALLKEKAPETYQVKFETARGEFTVTVTRAWAPTGADRFYNLVKHHFFDNASFFRVIPNFMAQFGISAYPAVSAAWEKATIKDDPVTQSNKRGYMTFATAGPDTRTTQVFINFKDNSRLDRDGFAPFGKIDDQGMKVVDMLYDVYGEGAPQGTGPDQGQITKLGKSYLDKGWPKLDSIKSATLVGAAGAAAPAKPATPKPATAAPKPTAAATKPQ
jgi:peptidyl-prolyl cis-trans isomerase A (cyclophilin A)